MNTPRQYKWSCGIQLVPSKDGWVLTTHRDDVTIFSITHDDDGRWRARSTQGDLTVSGNTLDEVVRHIIRRWSPDMLVHEIAREDYRAVGGVKLIVT